MTDKTTPLTESQIDIEFEKARMDPDTLDPPTALPDENVIYAFVGFALMLGFVAGLVVAGLVAWLT